MLPVIALVGRPNVGKSTLFNQITRSRDALVANFPGLTRDRKYGEARMDTRPFVVIDTGGIRGDEEGIDTQMAGQSLQAIEEADAVLFMVDAREALIKKAKIDLPVEFLKRWMVETNEQITEEQVAEDFDKYEDDFRWQLIKEHLLKQQDIKVSEEEALEAAKAMALNQYMQYGMSNVPDDYLENYAKEMMSKPEESRKFYEQKGEEKLISYIKSTVKLDEKEVSSEKFRKLYEK